MLGCPGEDSCPKIKMDPSACSGCPRNIEVEINAETLEFVEYARYLMKILEKIKSNIPEEIEERDRFFLLDIQKAVAEINAEIMAKKDKQ